MRACRDAKLFIFEMKIWRSSRGQQPMVADQRYTLDFHGNRAAPVLSVGLIRSPGMGDETVSCLPYRNQSPVAGGGGIRAGAATATRRRPGRLGAGRSKI